MEIMWKEPPERKTGRGPGNGKWQKVVAELKKRPGAWALVGEDVSAGTASHIKRYGLECTLREVRDGRAAEVYARWPEGSE